MIVLTLPAARQIVRAWGRWKPLPLGHVFVGVAR